MTKVRLRFACDVYTSIFLLVTPCRHFQLLCVEWEQAVSGRLSVFGHVKYRYLLFHGDPDSTSLLQPKYFDDYFGWSKDSTLQRGLLGLTSLISVTCAFALSECSSWGHA